MNYKYATSATALSESLRFDVFLRRYSLLCELSEMSNCVIIPLETKPLCRFTG